MLMLLPRQFGKFHLLWNSLLIVSQSLLHDGGFKYSFIKAVKIALQVSSRIQQTVEWLFRNKMKGAPEAETYKQNLIFTCSYIWWHTWEFPVARKWIVRASRSAGDISAQTILRYSWWERCGPTYKKYMSPPDYNCAIANLPLKEENQIFPLSSAYTWNVTLGHPASSPAANYVVLSLFSSSLKNRSNPHFSSLPLGSFL